MHENERESQSHIKDDYKGERNGSEWENVEEKSFATFPLANEVGNTEDQNGAMVNSETNGHKEIHEQGANITANGIRKKVIITDITEATNGSSFIENTDNSNNWAVEGAHQRGDTVVVQEDRQQGVESNSSVVHEVEIHGTTCRNEGDQSETTAQIEDEINENEEVGVTQAVSSTRQDLSLDNSEGNPSGNGDDEYEDKGSGDDESDDGRNGKDDPDNSKGQESPVHGKEDNDNSLGQDSISSEDDDPNGKESHDNEGNNTSKSEEDNADIPEDKGDQGMEDNPKLSNRENKGVGNEIRQQSQKNASGKSQEKVSL